MNETRTLTTRKGRTIETPHTDTEALALLMTGVKAGTIRGNFAHDLNTKATRYTLSPDQITWVHILVVESATPRAAVAVEGLNLEPIVDMLDRAAAAQKRCPKIRFPEFKIVLSRAGSRSRYEGSVQITDGGPYGENVWYGRINPDGSVTRGRAWTDKVHEVLAALADDPAKVASQHGVATGECCFCGRELSTIESRSVGYGPICAGKFGLPWGDVDPAFRAAGEPGAVTTTTAPAATAAATGTDDLSAFVAAGLGEE